MSSHIPRATIESRVEIILQKFLRPMRFLAIAFLLLILATPPAAGAEESFSFTTIAAGTKSGIRRRNQVVIRTPSEWRALWQEHTAGLSKVPMMPVVDFPRDMVIAVFAGEVPETAGVSISKIFREGNRLTVLVRIADLQPGPALVEAPLATPYHIVRLSRSALPVVFVQVEGHDIYQPGR